MEKKSKERVRGGESRLWENLEGPGDFRTSSCLWLSSRYPCSFFELLEFFSRGFGVRWGWEGRPLKTSFVAGVDVNWMLSCFSLPFEGHSLGWSSVGLSLVDWFLTSCQHCLLSGKYTFHFISLGLFVVLSHDEVFWFADPASTTWLF